AHDCSPTAEVAPLHVVARGVLTNATRRAADRLSAVLVSGPANGSLTLNSNGSFSYIPTGNYIGPDSFTYKANDGQADSGIATVSITITGVNDAPVAVKSKESRAEDDSKKVMSSWAMRNDSDVNGDSLR